jgi:chromosome segregation ATPase
MSIGNYDVFSNLITNANVNNIIDTKNGYTSLHYAIKFDNEKMMEFLLNMGANPYLKTVSNEDSFDLSLRYQNKYVISHQLNNLKEVDQALQKRVSKLEKKISDMDINNNYLVKSVDDLVMKNNLLKTQVCDLKKEQTCLKNKNGSLIHENTNLLVEKSSIEKKNNEFKKDIILLEDKVLIFKKDNEVLNNDLKSLKRKYNDLDQSYSGLLAKIRK